MANESITIPRTLLIQLEQAAGSYDSKNETAARQAREILESGESVQSPVDRMELALELRAIAASGSDTMADELMGVSYRLELETAGVLPAL